MLLSAHKNKNLIDKLNYFYIIFNLHKDIFLMMYMFDSVDSVDLVLTTVGASYFSHMRRCCIFKINAKYTH